MEQVSKTASVLGDIYKGKSVIYNIDQLNTWS